MESAQDLVQETFLLATFNQKELLSHPMPEGWLMITLKNLVKNEKRRLERHPEVSLECSENLHINADLTIESLDSLLPKQLSTEDSEILIWRFMYQIDYNEIAYRLGISESGSRSRVFRAIKHCRKYIKEF